MKLIVPSKVEVNLDRIIIDVPVLFGEEDIPKDFPLRRAGAPGEEDRWVATVDIHTGKIREWPEGKTGILFMKVCDAGTYTLLDRDGKQIAERTDYVPYVIPSEGSDYIDLKIGSDGIIANWGTPDDSRIVEYFFPADE
jgi:hypothetical protein